MALHLLGAERQRRLHQPLHPEGVAGAPTSGAVLLVGHGEDDLATVVGDGADDRVGTSSSGPGCVTGSCTSASLRVSTVPKTSIFANTTLLPWV